MKTFSAPSTYLLTRLIYFVYLPIYSTILIAILDEAFTYIIKNTTARQAKWFLRIVLKDLKLAMGKGKILAAVHPDAPEYYESCSSLSKVLT